MKIFSASGEFLKKFGRRGDGPGEFRSITSVRRCAGDSVVVYDGGLFRLALFDQKGAYIRNLNPRDWTDQQLPPYDIWCSAAGAFVALHRSSSPPTGVGPRRPEVAMTVADPAGRVVEIGTFPASERYFLGSEDIPRPLGKITAVGVGLGVVYVGTGDKAEITELSLLGQLVGTLALPQRSRAIEPIHVDTFIKELLDRQPHLSNRDRRLFERAYKDLDYPETFPFHGNLLVDWSGNLWVEDYPVPGAPTRGWSIFSKRRTMTARLRVPASLQIVDATAGAVLGIWRDSLDAEFIRTYPLMK